MARDGGGLLALGRWCDGAAAPMRLATRPPPLSLCQVSLDELSGRAADEPYEQFCLRGGHEWKDGCDCGAP